VFGEFRSEPASRVEFRLDESHGVVRLTVRHDGFPPNSRVFRACSDGWPMILSNLKTLLETHAALPAFEFAAQLDRFD
jgi:uncharacterized protein YndB with AHSA1/START domain